MAFFYVSGFLFQVSALCLFILGLVGFPVRLSPRWLTRAVSPLAFVLIGCSLVLLYTYALELFIAVYSANAYERLTYFDLRSQNWFFWLEIIAAVVPQLFWFAPLRRRPTSIVCISITSISPRLFEYGVVAVTQYFRPS